MPPNYIRAANRTGHYVSQLLEPALTAVPLAADVPKSIPVCTVLLRHPSFSSSR